MNPIYDNASTTETKPKSYTNTSVSNPNYDTTIATQRRITANNNSGSPSDATDNPLYESSTDVVPQGGNPIYESYTDQQQNPLYETGSEPLATHSGYPVGMNPIYDGLPADKCGGAPAEACDTGPNPVYESSFDNNPMDASSESRFNPIYEIGDVSANPANDIAVADPVYADASDPDYDNATGSSRTGNGTDFNPVYEATSDIQPDIPERKPRGFSLNRSEPSYSKLDTDTSDADDESSVLRKRSDSKPKGSGRTPDEVPFTEDAGYDNDGIDVMNELYGSIDMSHEKNT
jgi:hypothetical protein